MIPERSYKCKNMYNTKVIPNILRMGVNISNLESSPIMPFYMILSSLKGLL